MGWSDAEARRARSFLAAVPSLILQAPEKAEHVEWFAAVRRRATNKGRGIAPGGMPGFRRKRDDARFVCWYNGGRNATLHRLGRRNAVVVISGQNPADHPGPRRRWQIAVKVRLSQPVRDYTSVAVNWTRRTLVFTNPPQAIPRTPTGAEVGIDRGVVHHAVTSDGDFHDLPAPRLRDLDRRVRRHQKAMARARKIAGFPNARDYNARGRSRRYQAHETTIKTLKARAGRIVEDQQHKLTTDLIRHYDHIAVEDLNLAAMLRSATPVPDPLRPVAWLRNGAAAKRGLNRAIAGARMGRLVEMLTYKAALAGVTLTKVDPRYTSQRCNQCGHTASENRESQAVFSCVACGHASNADLNAARNIRDRAAPTWARTVPSVEPTSDADPALPAGARATKREPYLDAA